MKKSNTDQLKYFIYARKSSEGEERQARSIEDQLRETWELARKEKLNIVGEFQERQTASKPGRPKFAEMLARMEQGEADAILAWEPNRLARNSVDGGKVIHLLDTEVIRYLSFANYHFTNDSHGKFALYMAFAQSKYYSDNLSENIHRGIKSKLERGVYPNWAKRGYINHPKNREIIPDPDTFPLIAEMYELYASGKAGLHDIGIRMHERGMSGCSGNPLSASQIQRMIKDPFYYGAFDYSGERYQGAHKPAVSRALWDKAQDMMRNRGKAKGRHRKHDFAFRGFMVCAECGRAITAETQKGHVYYRCTKRDKDKKCSQPYLREDLLQEQLGAMLAQLRSMPLNWVEKMLGEIEAEESGVNARNDSELGSVDLEHKEIQTRLSRLADLYVGGDLDRVEYNAKKAALIDRKVALLEARKEIAKGAAGMKFERLKEPLNLVLELKNAPAGDDLLKLRGIAAKVGSNWKLDSRNLLWDWLPSYAPLAQRGSFTDWRRGRDSNPRYLLQHTRFPGVHLKPLGHLSPGGVIITFHAS